MALIRIGKRFAANLPTMQVVAVTGLVAIAATACAGGGFAVEKETIHDSFTVGAAPTLVVDSSNGRITVEVGEASAVSVTANLRNPDKLDYTVSQVGDTISVIADSTQPMFEFHNSPGADITVIVPPETHVDLRTSNGRIEVDGISGTCRARTSNGSIDLENVTGEVEARTSNGSIEHQGMVPPESSNELRTSNGSISVSFTADPDVEIDASTSNGRVSSSRPIAATRTESTHLVGTMGEGGADLIIRTSNGSVTIK